MPKFLIDESTGRKTFDLLIAAGFEAKFVGDLFRRAPDEKIIAFAEKENFAVITDDKDFGELVFRAGNKSSGVILFRTKSVNAHERVELLKATLKTNIKIEKNFIVITENSVRVKKIP